jgi:hypothetical protein
MRNSSEYKGVTMDTEHPIKSTVAWEGRIGVKEVATIIRFFEANNIKVRSRSELIARVFEEIAALIVSNKVVEEITKDSDAVRIIAQAGLPMQTSRRKATALIRNLRGDNNVSMRYSTTRERGKIVDMLNADIIQETPEFKAQLEEELNHREEFEAAYIQQQPTLEQQKHINEAVAALKQQQASDGDPTAEEIEQFKKEQEEKEQQEAAGQAEFVKALKRRKAE